MKSKGRKPIPVKIVHDEPSSVAEPYREKDRMNISIRQINNGYIVNKHGYKGGKHFDEEFYSPKAPAFNAVTKTSSRSPARNARLKNAKF